MPDYNHAPANPMLARSVPCYPKLRSALDTLEVCDTHEHHRGCGLPVRSVFDFFQIYDLSDFNTASFGWPVSPQEIFDAGFVGGDDEFNRVYDFLEPLLERTRFTSYGRAILRSFHEVYGVRDLSRASLLAVDHAIRSRDAISCKQMLDSSRIGMMIVDLVDLDAFFQFLHGTLPYDQRCRFVITIPPLINLTSRSQIELLARETGIPIASLDDYVRALDHLVTYAKRLGVVAAKDQSAYIRPIAFHQVDAEAATRQFARVLASGGTVLSVDDTLMLGNYLFNHLARILAREHLPLQIHTGHMARVGAEIDKARAKLLVPTLNAHPDLRFSLFHGNWPYDGDLLFIAKNCPNASVDLCWLNTIDPLYYIRMLKQLIMTVPTNKIFAFGGDAFFPELTVGYLAMAKDSIACALSDLISDGWLGMDDALWIARQLLWESPKNAYTQSLT